MAGLCIAESGCCAADVEYNLKGFTKMDGMFGVFNALGTVAFAYGGHNVILEIQVGSTLLLLIGSPSRCELVVCSCTASVELHLDSLSSIQFLLFQLEHLTALAPSLSAVQLWE